MDGPRFTLTTTDAPRTERRAIALPTLTVERGPKDVGRAGVVLEPEADGNPRDEVTVQPCAGDGMCLLTVWSTLGAPLAGLTLPRAWVTDELCDWLMAFAVNSSK